MSSGARRGGYTKVVYGTTVGLSTSTEITGLLSGTLLGDGEALTAEDAAGKNISTGYRQSGEIHTSAVTAAFITNLIAAQNACTDLYFRLYHTGGNPVKVNSVRVTVRFTGAAPGELHRAVVAFTNFEEDAVDAVTFE